MTVFLRLVLSVFCSASWSSMLVLLAKVSPPSATGPVHVSRSPSHQNTRQRRMVSGHRRTPPEGGPCGQGGLTWPRSSLRRRQEPGPKPLTEAF